jgi:hypothetical protein
MNHDRYDDSYIRGILNTVPADLPVLHPTKALGLTIPETLLATADEVIQ